MDYKDMTIVEEGVKCRMILSNYFIPFYNGARHMAFMLHGHTHRPATSVMEERMKEIRLENRAKLLLIQCLNMTETDAHRYIQQQAMNCHLSKREVAESIIQTYHPDT